MDILLVYISLSSSLLDVLSSNGRALAHGTEYPVFLLKQRSWRVELGNLACI